MKNYLRIIFAFLLSFEYRYEMSMFARISVGDSQHQLIRMMQKAVQDDKTDFRTLYFAGLVTRLVPKDKGDNEA